MVKLFVLFGSALLLGGIAAIIDGWPYLVLERGFTEVIIGTVSASGGVILLALSWVLVELRRLKTEFVAARLPQPATAVPAPAAPEMQAAPRRQAGTQEPAIAAVPDRGAPRPGLAAGAGLAAELARRSDDRGAAEHHIAPEAEPELDLEHVAPAPAPAEADERELYQGPMLGPEETAVATGAPPAEPPQAVDAPADRIDDDDLWLRVGDDEQPTTQATTIEQPQPVEPAEPEPEETVIQTPSIISPPEPEVAAQADASDEFAVLRKQLTELADRAQQDAAAKQEKNLDEAAAWMTQPERREPFFQPLPDDEEAVPQPEADEPPLEPPPVPQSEIGTGPATADITAAPGITEAAEPDLTLPPPPVTPEPSPPSTTEPEVVGAYHVGDMHFTMFSDGSIKALSPDGEYHFASMEALKAYLAENEGQTES